MRGNKQRLAADVRGKRGGNGASRTGSGATAYAEAVAVYLALVVSSLSDRMSTICTWDAGGATWGTKTRNTFARQAIPMSWDFAEVNPLSSQSGSFNNSLEYTTKEICVAGRLAGSASQQDATTQEISRGKIVSTDPPYYDNIGYADLSDYFYVWLRRSLKPIFPDLFATAGQESVDNSWIWAAALYGFHARHSKGPGLGSGGARYKIYVVKRICRSRTQSRPAFLAGEKSKPRRYAPDPH